MSSDNLSFLDDGQSIASTIGRLHHYFKTGYSRHKTKRSDLVSRLEGANADELTKIEAELRELDQALSIFGILADALSIADRALHMESATSSLSITAELYQIHLENESEQAMERAMAERRVASQQRD